MSSRPALSRTATRAGTQAALRRVLESTAASTGEDFLRSVVKGLALSLEIACVSVDEAATAQVTSIIAWCNGKFTQRHDHPALPHRHEIPLLRDTSAALTLSDQKPLPDFSRSRSLLDTIVARLAAELARRGDTPVLGRRRDALTGSLDHGAITEALGEALAANDGQPCAVAMVDIDGMKATNNTYGDRVGDDVLVRVASLLRRDGAIVGRYGADEFIVVLPSCDRDAAEAFREEVLAAVQNSGIVDPASNVQVPVSVSVGLAIYPDEGRNVDELIGLADSNMHASRRDRWAASGMHIAQGRPSDERAARLLGEIVPLLTAQGSRDEKLQQVANQLSVGSGYDAVNFEMTGTRSEEAAAWERTFTRASRDLVEAWMREQSQTSEHPLSAELERTRRPIFLDRIETDERLTPAERQLISAAGLKSGLVVPMVWQDRVVGMLSVCSRSGAAFTAWDAQFLSTVASQVTAIVFMTSLVEELRVTSADLMRAHTDTVVMLAAAAEAHDHTTGRHLQRVQALSEALARELGYTDAQARQLGLAAVLHDIGKIRVPDSVLTSPDKLRDDQWVVMKQHTLWGAEFLDGRPGFELAAVVARSHHEKWDGTGYPLGLAGEAIPEAAAITSVADSFDAMTNDRPYRMGRPVVEAVREIVAWSGRQFSPQVVDALVRLFERNALTFSPGDERDRRAA